ncbi:MAG TPA: hypothetical protein VG267_16000 [Terracidiphilus sp.]|jgi:hypothetical protein|nr:hypothetical protein [Terracidiphilus sp.]
MNIDAYSPQVIIGGCVVVLFAVVVIAWGIARQRQRRRTEELRRRFGAEYDYALRRYRSRGRAEAALGARLRRMEQHTVRPLTSAEDNRFLSEWDGIQARFVEHPRGAVTEADELINNLLQARGYPGTRFEQRADDLSVTHPRFVDPYRRAYDIMARAGKNEATTEELRTAMILYRALFDELTESKTVEIRHAEAA